jgi:hypothetical protein
MPWFLQVEKQCAHFYAVTISEEEVSAGLVCRVESSSKSKFKLLYFDQEANSGLSLALQEDSKRTGKITSAGMYFLGFPVYRLDHTINSVGSLHYVLNLLHLILVDEFLFPNKTSFFLL